MVMAPKETTPRNLRVHTRGNRFTLGQVAPRGFVQVISSAAPPLETTGFSRTAGHLMGRPSGIMVVN
jgi:hypothetical protein